MSDTSRVAYIWIAILGLIISVLGVMLEFVSGWEFVGVRLFELGEAVLFFSIAILVYSKV